MQGEDQRLVIRPLGIRAIASGNLGAGNACMIQLGMRDAGCVFRELPRQRIPSRLQDENAARIVNGVEIRDVVA